MKCPFCGFEDSKVIDSRPSDEKIRRRRECLSCQKRFTTFEIVEHAPLVVIKKDKTREEFDRDKLLNSLVKACSKRHVSLAVLENAVSEIEASLYNELDREVPYSRIGELAMKKLAVIDDVAYVRFASVYRQFKDIDSFMAELKSLIEKNKGK
ncbi:MAG: transcriptional regulator NrdR [Clostridiales bacterium]|nr:MAG: transcriptional regulator NrdR [Clostridiales bacterium]